MEAASMLVWMVAHKRFWLSWQEGAVSSCYGHYGEGEEVPADLEVELE